MSEKASNISVMEDFDAFLYMNNWLKFVHKCKVTAEGLVGIILRQKC